ncbi:MAG: hypothetical protein MUP70_07605 [Candidatus Aminicenantes bacterium]|nr:hypothetical protein [Candidatus Aminicenantes bacterium]
MRSSLEEGRFEDYLLLLTPSLRVKEEGVVESYLGDLGFETISLFPTQGRKVIANEASVFYQVLYENKFSTLIEVWRLSLINTEDGWKINDKKVTGTVSNFYKIQIPSERVQRAQSVRIQHVDIELNFKDALVFYDNLPDFESALLIIGQGDVRFSPSVEAERHQLELVYGQTFLRDEIRYVYLRFSNSYFLNNIVIVPHPAGGVPVTELEKKEASLYFARHYSRSFTSENSLTGQTLSSLPQGDETVMGFDGKKIGLFTYIFSSFAEEEINFYQWQGERMMNLYSPAMASEEKKMFFAKSAQYDLKHYQIDIDFDPKTQYFSGRARIDLESERGGLSFVKFKLHPALEILRISDAEDNSLFFSRDKIRSNLYVYFLEPIELNERRRIDVFYRGYLPPPDAFSDVISGAQADRTFVLIPPPEFETFLYSRSAYWYPAPEQEDYFTADIKIILPQGVSVLANGRFIETSRLAAKENVGDMERAGREASFFKVDRPVKYLTFFVGNFRLVKENMEGIPIRYYRTRDSRIPTFDPVAESKRILSFYESRFGEYPYEKLSIAQRPWKTSGGHSPASFIILNELPRFPGIGRFIEKGNPVNLTLYQEYYLAHEIAHQWWGQGVAWDTYRDIWLSEGLAQFAAVLYIEEFHGQKALHKVLRRFAGGIKKFSRWGSISLGSRISFFNFEAFQTIVYNKSALALFMLRDILGSPTFFRGLEEFYNKNQFNSARSADFFRIMSKAAGRDLGPFFDTWFKSYRLPEVDVISSAVEADDGFALSLRVNQTAHASIFPLDVEWEENGVRKQHRITVDKASQTFVIPTDEKPRRIKIDPKRIFPGRLHKK